MRCVLFVFCTAAMLLLGGCQQIAWKPGASAADLERDTAACKAQFADEPAAQSCLKQRGWVLRQPASNNESPAADGDNSSAADNDAMPCCASQATAGAATAAPEKPASAQPIAADSMPAKPVSAKPAVAKDKKIDPLATTLIQAWWKTGAQAADLSADQEACVEKLGPAHRPDLQKRLYTRGLIDCLVARGWSGH